MVGQLTKIYAFLIMQCMRRIKTHKRAGLSTCFNASRSFIYQIIRTNSGLSKYVVIGAVKLMYMCWHCVHEVGGFGIVSSVSISTTPRSRWSPDHSGPE